MRARSFPAGHAVLVAALVAVCAPSIGAQAARTPPVSNARQTPAAATAGVYTEAQAARGDKVFSANCVSCHGRKDMSNPDFQLKWNGRTVFDLFDRVQSTMPESDPGGLSTTEYTDVVAYLLKLNGMPAGKTPIATGPAMRQQKLTFGAR